MWHPYLKMTMMLSLNSFVRACLFIMLLSSMFILIENDDGVHESRGIASYT